METTNNNTKWPIIYDIEGKIWIVHLPHTATVALQRVCSAFNRQERLNFIRVTPKLRLKQVGACIS